jgi:hypothetical protein
LFLTFSVLQSSIKQRCHALQAYALAAMRLERSRAWLHAAVALHVHLFAAAYSDAAKQDHLLGCSCSDVFSVTYKINSKLVS